MESKAVIKNVGISTKKARIPATIVRGLPVVEAVAALQFMRKGSAEHVLKAIKSATANAQSKGANISELYVSEIRIDKGQNRIKHYHPRAKGGGYYMWLRGKSHITVILKDRNEVSKIEGKKQKVESKKTKVESEKVVETKVEKKAPVKKTVAKKSTGTKAKKKAKSE